MPTRRQFCKHVAAAVAAAVAGIETARAADAKRPDKVRAKDVRAWMRRAGGTRGWQIGAGLNGFASSSGHYKKTYPIEEVLAFCRREGFDGIELVQGWPRGNYPSPDDDRAIDALKKLYGGCGLKPYTIQSSVPGRPFAESAEERKAWVAGFRGQVRLCKKLGCDFIGHWPGGGLGKQTIDQAIDHCVESYRHAARMCADEGMWLSFEIEPPFVFHTLEHLQRILEGVDHPACKTNYDPSHFDLMSGSKGTPEVMLRKLGVKHIGHVHLTDTDGTMFGGTSKHLACGEGHCDIRASLDALWKGGYRGWIMIDGWLIEDVYNACSQGKAAIDAALRAFQG